MGAKKFVNSKYKCHKTFPNLMCDIQQPLLNLRILIFVVDENNYYCLLLHYKNVNKQTHFREKNAGIIDSGLHWLLDNDNRMIV